MFAGATFCYELVFLLLIGWPGKQLGEWWVHAVHAMMTPDKLDDLSFKLKFFPPTFIREGGGCSRKNFLLGVSRAGARGA